MTQPVRERGFTLIEIMVSMALLVIGLLGVIALHATTVKGNRMSRQLERAKVYAAQVMEDLRGKDVTTMSGETVMPELTTTDGVVYRRKYAITDSSGLKMVTVTVEFYDNGDETDLHSTQLQMLRTGLEKL